MHEPKRQSNLSGVIALFGLAFLAAVSPGWCAEPPPAPEKPSPAFDEGPVIASTWCVVKSSAQGGPGCDVGAGVALVSWRRVHWVAVIGSKTVGTGFAWTVRAATPSYPHAIAIAVGVVAPRDSAGIGRHLYPALGATISFGGKPSSE